MARKSLPIRQQPSGGYKLRWHEDGKQPSRTFATYGEAKTFWMAMQTDKARGVWIDPIDAAITFQDYAENWRAGRVGATSTADKIEISLRCHLYPLIGAVPLRKLRKTQLQQVVAALLSTLAPGTVHTVVQHLQQVLNGAVQDQLLTWNPGKGLVLPRVVAKVVIPSPDEVAAIVGHIAPSSRALIVVGAGLGLRQGEAFGLSIDRVDFLRRRVAIDRQLRKTSDEGLHLSPKLKTDGSYRTIPLPENVGHAIARHIAEHPNDDPDGLLFTTPLGCRWRASTWNTNAFKPAVSAADRPELTFHALRHFYASALIRQGLSATVIGRRMGNSASEVLKTYAHLWRDDDERTRDAIDAMLAI